MRALVVAALLAALGVSAPAAAQSFNVPVAGSQSITLALATPVTPAGNPEDLGGRVRGMIARDLDMTGFFTLVPEDAQLDRSSGVEPGSFSFDPWKPLRVGALVKLRVLAPGDKGCDPSGRASCVDAYVYDAIGGELLGKKRVRGGDTDALAHQAASEILQIIAGQPCWFGDSVVAVGERSGNKELYLVALDGSGARAITRNGALNLSPAWSADKKSVAWTSYKRGNPDVFVKDLASGDVRALSTRDGLNLSPAFSPDGRFVALARSAGADTDLFLVDARTGKDVRQLTTGGGIDVSPTFSPDGRRIAFASERSGGSQIYTVSVEGGEPSRVTRVGGQFTDPSWSPDGKHLAFVSRQGGDFDVFTIGTDGSDMTRITQGMGDNEDPSWSPDGRYLVFTSTRDGRRRIWISTVNGRHQIPVTRDGGWSQPVWTN